MVSQTGTCAAEWFAMTASLNFINHGAYAGSVTFSRTSVYQGSALIAFLITEHGSGGEWQCGGEWR